MQPNPHIKYFKRRVNGDDIVPRPAEWGGSSIYYETSEEGFPIRQIQMFESGIVLAYDNRIPSPIPQGQISTFDNCF